MNLYFMIGIPSSGKSTWARKTVPGSVIVSVDDIREELFGDPEFPFHNGQVFRVAHSRVIQALKAGRDVIYDHTNLNPGARHLLLRRVRAERLNVNLIAVVMDVTSEEAIELQKWRARKVPHSTIRLFDRILVPPVPREGFSEIRHVRPALAPSWSPGLTVAAERSDRGYRLGFRPSQAQGRLTADPGVYPSPAQAGRRGPAIRPRHAATQSALPPRPGQPPPFAWPTPGGQRDS